MNKIDVTNWKKFSLKELSFICHHGKRIKKSDRIDGDLIFLTAGKENNGVVGTIGNNVDIWVRPITVDMFGNSFYHPYNCSGDDNIYAFTNSNESINDYIKMFISTCINAETSNKYSYVDQFRQDNADSLSILLPEINNEPDWNYMETFIKEKEILQVQKLKKIKKMFNQE